MDHDTASGSKYSKHQKDRRKESDKSNFLNIGNERANEVDLEIEVVAKINIKKFSSILCEF